MGDDEYEAALDAIPDGVIITDAQGAIVRVNEAAVTLLGEPGAALLGRAADDVCCFLEDHVPVRVAARVLETGEVIRSQLAGSLVGSGMRIDWTASLLPRTGGVLIVIRDVTDRVKRIEKLVIADRLSSLSTMSSGISHEINNPLAYVLANVEYTREELEVISEALGDTGETMRLASGASVNEKLHALMESLQEATDGAKRVKNIVGDLRSFALVKQAARVELNLADVVDRAVRISRSKAKAHAALVVALTAVPPAIGDESRLTQVLVSLIANALAAIPEGSPKDNTVRLTSHVAPDGRIAVVVEDTGGGMTQETLRRVFDPFFTTKMQGEGMGLGLAIAHRMVTDMGGELIPESELGRGTKMTILLHHA